MFARPLRLAAVLLTALAASACQNTKPPMQKLPEISFAHLRPIMLDVGQLEIVSEYTPPGRSPNIEHLMPVSPEGAAQRWAQDRLKPMGKSGFARVIIKDAKVVEVPLAIDKGFTGAFKKEQEARYDAALDVAVQILDARHMVIAEAEATAARSRTVPEGMTLNERDRIQYDISESLARDIDLQMEPLIRNYLGRWIIQ
ncbi:conserved exported hypothetical protein [Candidatus Terasakiella magnetica]|nr:conserved exported hypothetical protein [Candidatus Terasakiella magnetica]